MLASQENLITAAKGGNNKKVIKLLTSGADVNAAVDGSTPLQWAVKNDHLEVVKALLKYGADVNAAAENGVTPVFIAAGNGHLAVVKALLDAEADINAAAKNGVTPLSMAAGNGHLAVVKALLDAEADINAAAKNGVTPLSMAAGNGHPEVVIALVQAGADLEAKSNDGDTVLHWAANNGHSKVVKCLKAFKSSEEYNWRRFTPIIRRAAQQAFVKVEAQPGGSAAAPESQLVKKKRASIEGVANRVIPVFLHLISLPEKRLAFAQLLNDKLSEGSPLINPDVDLFPIIGSALDVEPKRISPKIMENFAKIMAALDALGEYKGSRWKTVGEIKTAGEIIDKIIELTKFVKIFTSDGTRIGIDEVIQTLSGDNYAEVFATPAFRRLTTLQKVISDVSRMLGGDSYPDRGSFVKLKEGLDPEREKASGKTREAVTETRKKLPHPSIPFGWTHSLFDNPDDNEIYNLDDDAAAPEPEPEPLGRESCQDSAGSSFENPLYGGCRKGLFTPAGELEPEADIAAAPEPAAPAPGR